MFGMLESGSGKCSVFDKSFSSANFLLRKKNKNKILTKMRKRKRKIQLHAG